MLSNKIKVVVVPSPTVSSVLIDASFANVKMVFTLASSLSMFLAIVTPSFVIKGLNKE